MHKALTALFLFTLPFQLTSQVFPVEGSKLNYRIIGFSVPANKHTVKYKIEIAKGDYNSERPFEQNIARAVYANENKIIAEAPSFGCQYTWRAIYIAGDSSRKKTTLYHFSTLSIADVDTAITRLSVIKNAEKYKDAYVFVDGTRSLYDMKGNPVWFIPQIDTLNKNDNNIRDLKLTQQGTITFIIHQGIYDIDYNGHVLFKVPTYGKSKTDSTQSFHHEFTKLANGHYMALGNEYLLCHHTLSTDSVFALTTIDGKPVITGDNNPAPKISFGTIIEYDEKGNIIWYWRSYDYFKNSDVYFFKSENEFPDVHENSFYFDENAKIIYVSFKGIDRIVKLKYPGMEIMNVYGEIYKPGMKPAGNSLFCGQHGCRVSTEGYMYMFDNNFCNKDSLPKIIELKEPPPGSNNLEKTWEYQCNIDDIVAATKKSNAFHIGGNVIELPDRSFFASMAGASCTKLFIVARDKSVLWSAVSEKWRPNEKKWAPVLNYRASIITRKELEQLIWNSEKQMPLRHK